MTALARRLDPCLNWFKLLSRTKGRILWIFPAALFLGYLLSLDWGTASFGLLSLADQRGHNAPLLAEAHRLNLDFDSVAAKPMAYVGLPVAWCVSSVDGERGFVDENKFWPVVWTDPSQDLKTVQGRSGYCVKMLAVIQGVDQLGAVRLSPIEKL